MKTETTKRLAKTLRHALLLQDSAPPIVVVAGEQRVSIFGTCLRKIGSMFSER